MTPSRRGKIKIGLAGVFSVVVIFIIYQGFSSSFTTRPHQFIEKCVEATSKDLEKVPKFEPFQGEKLIHIDLKGAPPLVSYYQEFFPYIKKLGATGVLIEYEDMFFYKDELENLRAKNAYQPAALKTILSLAEANNLIVIPLVQVFGHFEFVLKLKEFKDLREIKDYPEVLCPSNEKVLPLIKKMIDQVLEAHPRSRYIHLGCDEVHYLGKCDRCKRAMSENKWTPPELYLNHVRNVALYVNETYPGVRPIIWGDMISKFRRPLLIKSEISEAVDLMVWKYTPNVPEYITDKHLRLYAKVFKTIWIASAFKGATGVNQRVTDVSYHLRNHISWMGIVDKWKKTLNFKGIALTGWQRYNHFAELCELLPVGIPSLTVNLMYLNDTDSGQANKTVKNFQCDYSLSPSYSYYSADIPECNFPGFAVYKTVTKFENFYKKIRRYLSLPMEGHFSTYNLMHKFGSPSTVKFFFDTRPVEEDLDELVLIEDELKNALMEVYDQFTVEEWSKTYVAPSRLKLEALNFAKEVLMEQESWPTRPLVSENFDFEKSAKEICASDRKLGCTLLLF